MAHVPDTSTQSDPQNRPLVSIIMANYCGAAYIEAALQSVMLQTERTIEIIVIDDASSDDSVALIKTLMLADSRIRLIQAGRNGGPARARNLGLDAAQGEWIAIFDSDDLMDAKRLAHLIAAAKTLGADLVADDLLYFQGTSATHARLFERAKLVAPTLISPEMFISGKMPSGATAEFGYIKPVIRRALVGNTRYDTSLTIGEDYDFVLRLLLGGARLYVLPEGFYRYRRHAGSISHRLSVGVLQAMISSQDALVAKQHALSNAVRVGFSHRRRVLADKLAYEQFLSALRQRKFGNAITMAVKSPLVLVSLTQSVSERVMRIFASLRPSTRSAP